MSRRSFIRLITGAGGASLLSVPLYSRFIEPWWTEVTRNRILLDDLPPAFDGFTIAQISYIHYHDRMPLRHLEEAVLEISRHKPDLIALTGDFLYGKDEERIHPLAEILSQLKAPEGVLAVPGNHDYWIFALRQLPTLTGKEKVVFGALERAGIQVLRNESLTLHREGMGIHIVGLDDYWAGQMDVPAAFEGLAPEKTRIVLAHNPDSILNIKRNRADLILCGHTHGGQVKLPFTGPLFIPVQLTQFIAGLYAWGKRAVYVNRGFGFVWYPLRLNARPEISLITLARSV